MAGTCPEKGPPGKAVEPFLATSCICSSFLPSWTWVSMALSLQGLVKMIRVNTGKCLGSTWLVRKDSHMSSPAVTLSISAEAWDRPLTPFLCPSPQNSILLSYLRFPSHFVSQQPIHNLEPFPLAVTGSKHRKGPPRSLSFRLCPKAELCSHRPGQMDVVSIQEIFIVHSGWAKPCVQDC